MKTWIKLVLTGVTAFAGGFSLGYFVRKKTSEVEIEEISQEELDKLVEDMKEAGKTEEASNDIFESMQNPQISQDEKEAYFKRWKEDPADIYDTRSSETPEDVVTDEDVEKIEEYLDGISEIEPGTMADWIKYSDRPDGEYDPIELIWYDADNVVCDEHGEPLDETEKFVGFDVKEEFYIADSETTGDPDVRVIFNHKTKSIYHITRVSDTSYSQRKRMEEYGYDGYDDEDGRPLL